MGRRAVVFADLKSLTPGAIFGLLKRHRHRRGPVGFGERGAADVGVQVAGLALVALAGYQRARLLDHYGAVDRHAPQHDPFVGADLGEPGEVDDALLSAVEVVGRLAQDAAILGRNILCLPVF